MTGGGELGMGRGDGVFVIGREEGSFGDEDLGSEESGSEYKNSITLWILKVSLKYKAGMG